MPRRTHGNRLLEQLDERSKQDDFPTWDNANYTCGAMRAVGFVWDQGEALSFEEVAYASRVDEVQRLLFAYGSLPSVGHVKASTWIGSAALREDLSDDTWRSRVSGVLFREDDGEVRTYRPPGGVNETFSVKLGKQTLRLPVRVPDTGDVALPRGKSLARLSPEEAILFQLCEVAPRDLLFSPVERLKKVARVPTKAKVLFVLDDWEHPESNEPASSSSDLEEMCAALVERRPLGRLRGEPNGNFRFWLRGILGTRSKEDEEAWGKHDAGEAPAPAVRPKPSSARGEAPRGEQKTPEWLAAADYHAAWDSTSEPCGVVRVTGFVSTKGPALVLEAIIASSTHSVDRVYFAYGPAVRARNFDGRLPRVDEIMPTKELFDVKKSGATLTLRCKRERGERLELRVGGRSIAFALELPGASKAKLPPKAERLRPHEVALYALCEAADRGDLFAREADLVKYARLPEGARAVARLEDPALPPEGTPLSRSKDLERLALALERGEGIELGPETAWRQWVARVIADRRASDAQEWTKEFRASS